MIDFYRINSDYLSFLKQYDSQVPNIQYEKHDKFFCGTVLSIDGINYFAPISSFKIPQRTNFIILDKQKSLSSVRLCFMIPVLSSVITKIKLKTCIMKILIMPFLLAKNTIIALLMSKS